MVRDSIRALLLSSLCLFFTSCIDFDAQTIQYEYDAKSDRLRLFQHYERIFSTDSAVDLSDKEVKQLAGVVDDQFTCFFDNWIFVYNRQALEQSMEKAKQQLAEATGSEKQRRQLAVELLERMIASITVTNGSFYLNEQKQLCGYQGVTIKEVSKLLDLANRFISQEVLADLTQFDEGVRDKVAAFAKEDRWITLDGNRLAITWPGDRDDVEMGEAPPIIQVCSEVLFEKPFVTAVYGSRDDQRAELAIKDLRKQDYNNNVRDYVRKHYALAENVDVQAIRDTFLKTGEL